MYNIKIDENFKKLCITFRGAMILAKIKNTESSEALWEEIKQEENKLLASYTIESIKGRSGIAATRQAYKQFGKDPSRYRPACEQLARRVLQGKGLYHVNTVVDILNLVSLASGYSTAALDAAHIVGNNITLGIGRAGEPYEGIGRGVLNILNICPLIAMKWGLLLHLQVILRVRCLRLTLPYCLLSLMAMTAMKCL